MDSRLAKHYRERIDNVLARYTDVTEQTLAEDMYGLLVEIRDALVGDLPLDDQLVIAFGGKFMQSQIDQDNWLEIETDSGETHWLPASVIGYSTNRCTMLDRLAPFIHDVADYTLHENWYGARLSAPGYLDSTDWCAFETEDEAKRYLLENYGDDN